ncbi:hypothetical protein, partial [Vibrio vulnificus]|uniref:hypothetical protein n=1 Tax=Vibrio vulnificus TaxID=672 RepID=UPI00405867C3
ETLATRELVTTFIEAIFIKRKTHFYWVHAISPQAYNAALRGECRLYQVSANHFHHKNYRKPKMPRGMNPS